MYKLRMFTAIAASRSLQRACAALVAVTVVSIHGPVAARQTSVAPDYSSRARAVVAALAAGRFDEVFADFSDAHGPNLSPASIRNGWNQVTAQSGQLQKVEAVQVADRQTQKAGLRSGRSRRRKFRHRPSQRSRVPRAQG